MIKWKLLLLPLLLLCRTVQSSIDAALIESVSLELCNIQMMGTSDEIAAIVYHVQLLYLSDSHSLAIELVHNYSFGSALEQLTFEICTRPSTLGDRTSVQ